VSGARAALAYFVFAVWALAGAGRAATLQPRAALSPTCAVKSVQLIGPGAGPDWSRTGGLIAYFLQDSSGIFQVYTMRPDGSGNQCLTCAGIAGAPAAGLHKGSPSWDPTGKYILFQSEMAQHSGPSLLSKPGSGWWNDLWLMTADGKQFWQLTHYPTTTSTAILVPRLARDGSKAFWSELIAGPFSTEYHTGILGRWRLNVADFAWQNSTPQILNTRLYSPGNGIFYESQDWSPDGTKVLFASDITLPSPYVIDIFVLDLTTRRLTDLTNTPQAWDEQAAFSPSGNTIAFMSSRNNPQFDPTSVLTLRAEAFLMDSNGKNVVQLSHFNTAGFPEYTPGKASIATKAAWNPDGTQLLQEQHIAGLPSALWMFTFAGACGAQ
jgi:Tol biopolymer transport system component